MRSLLLSLNLDRVYWCVVLVAAHIFNKHKYDMQDTKTKNEATSYDSEPGVDRIKNPIKGGPHTS